MWYKTTAIHRTPLPLAEISNLRAQLDDGLGLLDNAIKVSVILDPLCGNTDTAISVNKMLEQSIKLEGGGSAFTIEVTTEQGEEIDFQAKSRYKAVCVPSTRNPLPKSKVAKSGTIFIYFSKDEPSSELIVAGVKSVFMSDILFFNRHQLGSKELAAGSVLNKGSPYSDRIHLSFTLLIAYGSDFDTLLASSAEEALSLTSQKAWRQQIESLIFDLESSELSRFISSATFDSDIGLQYISESEKEILDNSDSSLYQRSSLVDSFDLQPVTILASQNLSDTRVLQFVYFFSPSIQKDKQSDSRPFSFTIANRAGVVMSSQLDTESAIRIFAKQIDKLLSPVTILLSADAPNSKLVPLRHEFSRIATITNLYAAVETLSALSHLVTSLKEMAVPKKVRELVDASIAEWSRSVSVLSNKGGKSIDKVSEQIGLRHAASAAWLAKQAVFEKNMMLNMFVPFEHKVAVYLPLLGPVLVPLFIGLRRVLKEGAR